MATVHLVHGSSAAGSIKILLAGLGRRERVVSFEEDLSFGPINPPDPAVRGAWREAAGVDDWCSLRSVKRFWHAAVDPSSSPVVWFSHRAPVEVTCLMEVVWRRRKPPRVIDVAEVPQLNNASRRVGIISHELMREHGLLARARKLTASEVDAMRTAWHWLRAENSDLRIIRDGVVRSVAIDYFDDGLMSLVGDAWIPTSTVLGNALFSTSPELEGLSEYIVWARIRALVDSGELEGQGDFTSTHTSYVRLLP